MIDYRGHEIGLHGSYLSFDDHKILSEEKKGKCIPLPWEKNKRKIFDKSDIEYRDGDNT